MPAYYLEPMDSNPHLFTADNDQHAISTAKNLATHMECELRAIYGQHNKLIWWHEDDKSNDRHQVLPDGISFDTLGISFSNGYVYLSSIEECGSGQDVYELINLGKMR